MRLRFRLLVAAGWLVALSMLTGCVEFFDLFEAQAFSESDDPDLKATGEAILEGKVQREVREAVDDFLETGDPVHLDRARALRPDDTEVRAMDVLVATRSGDPAAIAAAQQALTEAEARRLQGLNEDLERITGEPAPPISAEMLHRNVLGEILVAQTRLLGGSLQTPWDPPPPNAPEDQQALYRDYCATRRTIMNDFNDNLSYIPLPPCP